MTIEPDSVFAREIALWTTNCGDLYRGQAVAILDNLARKVAKGTYDAAKAPAAWLHLADAGARSYAKEFGISGPFGGADKATRILAAAEIAEHYDEELRERAAKLIAAAHPDTARKPIRNLTCCCCGEATRGRQHYNRDTGYGLCVDCIPRVSRGQTPAEVESCYGVRGVHFDVE